MMKKKAFLIGGVAVTAIAIGVILFFVLRKDKKKDINPEFAQYIAAYTSGTISKNGVIQVKLLSEIAQQVNKTKEPNTNWFDFSPSISGKCYWADETTIEFKPDKPLPSDQEFEAIFYLDKVVKVPDYLEEFPMYFRTIKQDFTVTIDEQRTIDKKALRWQKAIGMVSTADAEELDVVKKLLKAKQEKRNLSIIWSAGDNDNEFIFEIDSIARGDVASEITVTWDGSPMDLDKKGNLIVEIPSVKDFKFLSSKLVQNPEQYLQLQFSDPLQNNQQLVGLIDINVITGLQYVIDDNVVKIYPPNRLNGSYQVNIAEGIKNILGYKLKEPFGFLAVFEELKPAVRLLGNGVILPASPNGLVLPFEAVNLKAVEVKVIKIFEKNVAQFLQVNDLSGQNQLKRVGRPIVHKIIPLDQSNVTDLSQWNRYTLDLNDLIKAEPGAIYRITLGFRKSNAVYPCEETGEQQTTEEIDLSDENWKIPSDDEYSYWDSYEYGYYGYDYWEQRENPCHQAYYGENRSVSQNIIASNLGMIAKKGSDGSLRVFVNDILTTSPLSGVQLEVVDYQQQIIGTVQTDAEGVGVFPVLEYPFLVIAKKDNQRGYLRLIDGQSLQLSSFDVSGDYIQKGLKGFIYGERGVWRPGDSLFVTFILEENAQPLPNNHPIVMELRNPHDQLVNRFVQTKNSTGFYTFRMKTEDDAPTGNWEARAIVGGAQFSKSLVVETVKPNRLKVNLKFEKDALNANEALSGNLNVKWLHGAIAKNLDAQISLIYKQSKTTFKNFPDYEFDDPTKEFYAESEMIFDGSVDEEGNATVTADVSSIESAPGKLNATFVTKVFEQGGDFSIDQLTMPFYPYESFLGIRLPKGDKTRNMLLTDTAHRIDLVVVDEHGKPVGGTHEIEMSFYKMEWRWWWSKSDNDIVNYTSRYGVSPMSTETVKSANGKASWKIRVNYPDWGRYLVRAVDKTSGHSTAKVVYIDWPGWAGRQTKGLANGATMLMFTADKEKYSIGEKVKLTVPMAENSRALISIENGSKLIETHWLEAKSAGENTFTFTATKDMTPNVFINITLLQPHAQTINDLPIRMYGVIPILVENPATHLQPEIKMPEVLEPDKPVSITVSEKNNQEMTYTIAVVDEGLLDLTRYQTPDPWKTFYAREALGVKTWDIYDMVIGAYGDKFERLLSIGGGDEEPDKQKSKANRFKAVVQFLGPFHTKGGKKTHTFTMPSYIGSVRTMVIAGYNGAYGAVDKTTPVRKPLMVLGTLPRVLGPGETVKLPVSVFAMEKNIKNVTVSVKSNSLLEISDKSKSITFNQPGEENVDFDVKVQPGLGVGKVEITAVSGNQKAIYNIEIDVRNPNPKVTSVVAQIIQPGQSWNPELSPIGLPGTNKAVLEVSNIPPLNLEKRLQFLIQYPHGCIEQTTSAVFPQLFVNNLMQLDKDKQNMVSTNIKAGIQKLSSFQIFNGGFGYWPGDKDVSEWGTNYAGHFMVEAEKKGFNVPVGLMNNWKKYQRNKARNWTDDGAESQLIQAYRLFTLALAGAAENGAMNRLYEKSNLDPQAKWRLAAAFALAGKKKIAEKMVVNLKTKVINYNELAVTYGSDERDEAMILETLLLLGKKTEAFELVKKISASLSSEEWYSTQTTAYSLLAVAQFVTQNGQASEMKYSYKFNGGTVNQVSTQTSISQNTLPIKSTSSKLEVKNTGKAMLYARVIIEGVPAVNQEVAANNGLSIAVKYMTMDGSVLDPETLEQGTDFYASVTIGNPGIKGDLNEVVLNHIFPSGWEVINSRLIQTAQLSGISVPEYQDIRDDRVYSYFDLKRNEQKTFVVHLNASYEGTFYLPAVSTETMYDATINARTAGLWVNVIRPGEI